MYMFIVSHRLRLFRVWWLSINKSAKDDAMECFIKKKSLNDQLIEIKVFTENLQKLVLVYILNTLVIRRKGYIVWSTIYTHDSRECAIRNHRRHHMQNFDYIIC